VSEAYATLSDSKKRQIYDQYGKDAANQSDQMGDHGNGHGHGGFHGGFPGGGFGGGGHNMSQADADRIFSHIFGGGGDPFGGGFGGRSRMSGGDPMASLFGGMSGGGMGGGMHPGYARSRPRVKRFDTIPRGTIVSLRGLISKPELNGDRGEVESFDPNSGRYVVVLEDTNETMKVKPANLLQHVHVKVYGVESRPDLNGLRATVLAYDEGKERFNVFINDKGLAISLRPANVILDRGTVGMIMGIQAKPELNGKWGTIKSWNTSTQRYDVQLSADKIMRLKMDNIRL